MNEPSGSKQGGAFARGALSGGVVGFFVSVLVFGVAGSLWAKKHEADARRGWNLVPVVVAAQDIPEGTPVSFEVLQQRSVPEQFVTSSVVKPDGANYIIGQRLLVPVQAGDMLLWSQFETHKKQSPQVAGTQAP